MNIKLKDLLLIFLVALLGGYLGVFGGSQIHKEPTEPSITEPNTITREESSIKDAVKTAYDSVVEVAVTTKTADFFYGERVSSSVGSGVIISEDGYIITNDHVIDGATEVSVQTSTGEIYPASLIGTDSKTDLAVIKIEATGLKAATLADSDAVELGDTAIVIGNPLGVGISVSDGIISALDMPVTLNNETMYLIQTNAAVNQGNSGGGLFNINGELIGIVNAKKGNTSISVSVEGLGYAIPSNRVQTIATDIMENGYVKNRPTLGVSVSYVENSNQGLEKGLYIAEVYEGGAAYKAGLKAYDRIIGFNDTSIDTYADLSKALNAAQIGDTIQMKVVRDGKILDLSVTLQEAELYE